MSYVENSRNKGGGTTVVIVIAVLAACGMMFLVCGGIMVASLLPAVQSAREAALLPAFQSAREAARRMQCSNNMKQIALAIHNYADKYKSFPPAYTVDSDGNRLHSWRTLILPYMEESQLVSKIDFSKPWDHPDNAFAAGREIPSYKCPSSNLAAGQTLYLAIVDPQSIFPGETQITFREITDGTSNTVMVYETDPAKSVHWMDPSDGDLTEFLAAFSGSYRHSHTGGANCTFADGSVRFLSRTTAPATLRSLATVSGGEPTYQK